MLAHSLLGTLTVIILAQSAPVENDPVSVKNQIQQLGSTEYEAREQAMEALAKRELEVMDALKWGLRSPDAEIRHRCHLLILRAKGAALARKIKQFRDDKDGTKNLDIPGWKRFRELVGNDKESRELFLEMLRVDRAGLELVDAKPEAVGKAFGDRTQDLYQKMFPPGGGFVPFDQRPKPSRVQISTLLLMSASEKVTIPTTSVYRFFNFFSYSPVREALKDKKDPPLKRLVLAWMHRQKSDRVREQILRQATTYLDPKDVLSFALEVMNDKKARARGKAYAFTILGKQNDKKYVPMLEPFLTSKESVGGFGMGNGLQGRTQVRDVALAMILHLKGEQHVDYGYTYTVKYKDNDYFKFNAAFLGFSSDGERDAAFDKWEKKQKPAPKEQPAPKTEKPKATPK